MNWVASDFRFSSQPNDYNSPISSNLNHFFQEQRIADEKFIKTFESSFVNSKKPVSQQNTIKLPEGKLYLSQIIKEKESIKNLLTCLNESEYDFESQVSSLKERITKLKNDISIFENNMCKLRIKKKVKRRERLKLKKLKFEEMKKERQEHINKKHQMIEKFLSEKAEEIERVKLEAALKRQADSVLHEVRRKKFEAKKMLNLLSALKKLRELRSREEEERGGYCSKSLTETFNQVIERFKHQWEKQSGIYDLEEKGLKMMLEENSPAQGKDSLLVNNILEWEKVLFGEVSFYSEHEKLLTAANLDPNVMVQVRREWDEFLAREPTPMATSIPPGWVIPLDKHNNNWKAHIL